MNIIVTGASRGIGYETVKCLCESSEHHIVALSRNPQKLKLLVKECFELNRHTRVFPLVFDFNTQSFEDELIPQILQYFDSVDILINNAGFLVNKPIQDCTDEDFDQVFNVNIKAVFKLIRTLYPYLSSNSHILNISSMGGFQGSTKFPGLALYSAAKGAVATFTECLAEEFKEENFKVNCLALGSVQTEMLAEAFPGYEAPLSASSAASFISNFALTGHQYFNGKVLPVSISTP